MEFFEQTEEINTASDHTLWVEKWRPTRLDDYVGNDLLKTKFERFIRDNDIPHLLFHGRAGGGKSTAAKLIVKNIKCDYIYINASDERGIDIIRNKIKNFASSAGFSDLKVIILDEADYLTPDAQAALRNTMEVFSKHTRFILTCNYVEKIIDPIVSRTQVFNIIPPSKKDVAIQLKNILEAEKIEFEIPDIATIVNKYHPDIRKVINNAQMLVIDEKLTLDETTLLESDVNNKILAVLKSKDTVKNKFSTIRKIVADSKITQFEDIYRMLFDNVDEYANGKVANTIIMIADSQYKDSFVVDKEIQFMSLMIQLLGEL